jgi:hypothetical protein
MKKIALGALAILVVSAGAAYAAAPGVVADCCQWLMALAGC